MDYTDFQH